MGDNRSHLALTNFINQFLGVDGVDVPEEEPSPVTATISGVLLLPVPCEYCGQLILPTPADASCRACGASYPKAQLSNARLTG